MKDNGRIAKGQNKGRATKEGEQGKENEGRITKEKADDNNNNKNNNNNNDNNDDNNNNNNKLFQALNLL